MEGVLILDEIFHDTPENPKTKAWDKKNQVQSKFMIC